MQDWIELMSAIFIFLSKHLFQPGGFPDLNHHVSSQLCWHCAGARSGGRSNT